MQSSREQRHPQTIILLILLAIVILSIMPGGSVEAQKPTPSDDEVNAIARQLYCPVCENTPLDVCPTDACRQWRELIRQMLAEGKTEEEIKQYFVDNYGMRVLAQPPLQGLNWLVYLVPPAAFLAGMFLFFQAYRSWRKLDKQVLLNSGESFENGRDDKYIARFEDELRKRD